MSGTEQRYVPPFGGGGGGTVVQVEPSAQIHVDNTDPTKPVVHTYNEVTAAVDQLVESVVAGTNVTVDSTDPKNPIVSASGGASATLTEKIVTTAGYTLILTDASKILSLNTAANNTLTLPTNASVAFATGTVIYLNNLGSGLWQLAVAGGVTLNSPYSKIQLATKYAQGTLWYRGSDVWQLEGNLA